MADFKTCLIKDSKIGDITDKLEFAVVSGAANNTYQQFSAVTSSASSIVYNVQIPSESIVISREVLQQSTVTWQLHIPVGQTTADGELVFNYGFTDAVQSFPLSSLYTTMTSTINNTNVSINLQDVLPSLLRMNNSRELYRYQSMTAVLPDQAYLNYADGFGANNNPLGSYNTSSYDVDLNPRGSFPLRSLQVNRFNAGVDDGTHSCAMPAGGQATYSWVITMSAVFTEPLFLSPFIFGEPEFNCGGLAGINTMNFVFNVDSTCKRFFSTTSVGSTITLGGLNGAPAFQNTRLLLQFLSTQPSDMIPSRIVTPYHDFPRYLSLSNNSTPIPAFVNARSETTGLWNAPSTSTITSQNIQLNQLPDYFIITCRKPMSSQTIQDSTSFLTINSISINLNNQSGLLSSSTPIDLWKISLENGSTQSWTEFSGSALSANVNPASAGGGKGFLIPTTGSILILSPPKDLSLPDYLASSSIGQYNFQFSINVSNYYGVAVTPELCIITVNSGVFVSQMGSANIYTGVLTKQMVLDAKSQPEVPQISTAEYKRMVGGKMNNRVASAVGMMTRALGDARKRARAMVGAGDSGGVMMLGREREKHRLARHF